MKCESSVQYPRQLFCISFRGLKLRLKKFNHVQSDSCLAHLEEAKFLAELNESKRQTRAFERGWKQAQRLSAEIIGFTVFMKCSSCFVEPYCKGKHSLAQFLGLHSCPSQAVLDAKDLETLSPAQAVANY